MVQQVPRPAWFSVPLVKAERPWGGTAMPLARIDLIKGQPSQYRQTIGDVVYSAMVDVLRAPKDERFQVIAEHDEANFVYHPTFFGIDRSKDVIFVQLTLRKEDVFVSLVGTGREDWSFGNGEVSLVDTHWERRSQWIPFGSLDTSSAVANNVSGVV
jgi:4-oxalocrotonate tautomerase